MSMDKSERPKFEYYKHLNNLFTEHSFNELSPINTSSSGLCLENGKGLYMFFIPGDHFAINVHFPVPDSEKVHETWFNPLTGEYKKDGIQDFRRWKGYKSPWDDIPSILILEQVE